MISSREADHARIPPWPIRSARRSRPRAAEVAGREGAERKMNVQLSRIGLRENHGKPKETHGIGVKPWFPLRLEAIH